MATRSKVDLINSIVRITEDFRDGSIMNAAHVEQWVSQFDSDVQIPILVEIEHILENNYVSRQAFWEFLEGLLEIEEIFGSILNDYKNVKFLNIQERGGSQKDILSLLKDVMMEKYNLDINDCGNNTTIKTYVYR